MKAWQMFILQSLILIAPHLDKEKARQIAVTLIVVAFIFMVFEEFR